MRSNLMKNILRTAALAGASLALTVGVSSAAPVDVYLQAQSFDKALPEGASVPMWGFALCDEFWVCGDPTAPGPPINVSATDTLTIHVQNTLTTPVSIVIPGQVEDGLVSPVMFTDGSSRDRVQSFTHEVLPTLTGDYTWSSLRPGTYLYQSGTYPSIEVAMGLYGALVVGGPATLTTGSCATGQSAAYDDADSCFDADALVLFSEIDPWQNQRVANAAASPLTTECVTLAALAGGAEDGYPCTVDYTPTYFLINGRPYDKVMTPDPVYAGAGGSVLLRLLNAGLRSHAPAIVGLDMGLIAEDGNLYPGLVKQQSEALLPAGKTLDVLVAMPTADATYPLYDRFLDLTNYNQPAGGMLAYLQVGGGSVPPPDPIHAVDDVFTFDENTPLVGNNVLTNDVGLSAATVAVGTGPSNGTLDLNADGSFTYTTSAGFVGSDSFTYVATLDATPYVATVTLNISFINDLPVATADAYVNSIGGTITVDAPGVLGNDADPDGDTLTAVLDSGSVTLAPDGSFTYSGPSTSFTYHATDGAGSSGTVEVTLTVDPPSGVALTVQEPTGAPVTNYRWIVQEDATFHSDPNAPAPVTDQLSLNFHKSYMRVVAQGHGATEFADFARNPAKHYYVSVLPDDAGTGTGHTIGGAPIPPGTNAVTVVVNNQPIPTAQISVVVFEDNSPTNGALDGAEQGLGGFQISLEDAGGRYGQNGGTMSQDADGNPLKNWLPCAPPADAEGVILTCDDGTALIKNLPPGKYGVFVVAPPDTGTWTQTSTLEGTKIIDAWVKAGEPPFFVAAGAPGFHAFFGFVNPAHAAAANPGGGNSVSGDVTLLHDPRPPGGPGTIDGGSYIGFAHTRPWVGVNTIAGDGPNIAAVQASAEGHFEIGGLPDGTHELVVWDAYLDQVIAFQLFTVSGGEAVAVGNIPVNNWFTRQEHNVFLDENENGIRDDGEKGLPEQAVNLRWRDGTIFQSFPTDTTGFVPFDQIFPFFAWQIAEIDFTRFKPTGVTVTVDGGGDVSTGPYPGLLQPQIQADGVSTTRTDTEPSPVLLEAFQGFPGQTSLFDWGKAPYTPGQNGGIAGIVFYASTRGENDPRLTVGDTWEPGIPGVKVRLYREVAKPDGGTVLALVDEVETDSWDASVPTECPGEDPADPFTTQTLTANGTEPGNLTRCYDGWRNWNQTRPGVFDGGYAFTDLTPGKYVVEVVVPPGYELVKEEDKNVDFGDAFAMPPVAIMLPGGAMLAVLPDQAMILASLAPEPGLLQPPCVGELREVPPYLSLFPGEMMPAAFGGAIRPLCDRKEVHLPDQGQAAADFHLFTSTPVAAQFYGLITDDIASETNPASPGYGEKWSPAYLPFSIRDFKGWEVYRGYSDGFGHFNGVLPSTFSANIPIPSGYSPAMMSACLNDPGPVNGVLDPLVDTGYGIACYTAQYMPGTTTYLDTPILPSSAFAAGFNPPDCAFPQGTPVIDFVNVQGSGNVPWTDITDGSAIVVLHAKGATAVPNPAYEGPLAPAPYNQPTIMRDFGFGSPGSVTLDGNPLTIVQWNQNLIRARLPACGAPPCEGQLVVTRANGNKSTNAVTVTVSASSPAPIRVSAGGSIQAAIDAAAPGSLILVEPGTYEEMVIMWKPVRLQGSGAATIINAVKRPGEKVDAWIQEVQGHLDAGDIDLLPGQAGEAVLVGPALLGTELGAGITVLAANGGPSSFITNRSRIDGFTITGADGGGGIFVNGYAHNLEISNNLVTGNSGTLHGGLRIGHPFLPLDGNGPFAFNDNVYIHNNAVTLNGAVHFESAGGGVSLSTGTNDYNVSQNFVCGNYTPGSGAGIAHLGLSNNGHITANQVLFNQSLEPDLVQNGGGILVAGEPAAAPGLTLGAGNVVVDRNLIQGNHAAAGNGAGLRTQWVNGVDATTSPWSVLVSNNMIVNNVASGWGAGISLQDTISATIVNNTIADNDSTATAGGLITTGSSDPQPAGISSEIYSPLLGAALGQPNGFPDPALFNNIVWHNRSFSYDGTELQPVLSPAAVGGCEASADYWDLGVIGEPQLSPALQLHPTDSILTSTTGYDLSNVAGDPDFLSEYCNGARTLSAAGPMLATAAFGEGGNFLDVRYGPLTRAWPVGSDPWDYHIGGGSAGLDNANGTGAPDHDFDGEDRPLGVGVDRGADELTAPSVLGTVAFTSASPFALNGALDTLAFGDQPNGANVSSTVVITVSANPVTFQTLTVTGNTTFSKGADTCTGATVSAGNTCTVTINFSGQGNGMKSATLTVPHNGAGSPLLLAITGQ